jgi:uncharacterized lipoprotein YddW (UPF0748 family)
LRLHPGWLVAGANGKPFPPGETGYWFVNPGHPEVQKHVLSVVTELVKGYAVDGLHLDYCRYPATGTSFDSLSNRLFQEAKRQDRALERSAWQRARLTGFVKSLKETVQALRPGIEISAAVTGIYQDRFGWGEVSRGLDDFHQDSAAWAAGAAVDALVPMIYWPPTNPKGGFADFATLVEDFAARRGKARLLAGISVESGPLDTLKREVELARAAGFDGFVLFSWAGLKKQNQFAALKAQVFSEPALARPPAGLPSPPGQRPEQQPDGSDQRGPVPEPGVQAPPAEHR